MKNKNRFLIGFQTDFVLKPVIKIGFETRPVLENRFRFETGFKKPVSKQNRFFLKTDFIGKSETDLTGLICIDLPFRTRSQEQISMIPLHKFLRAVQSF